MAHATLLPRAVRSKVYRSWYAEADEAMRAHEEASMAVMDAVEGVSMAGAADPQRELRTRLRNHLAPALDDTLSLEHPVVPPAHRAALRKFGELGGLRLAEFPEVAPLSVSEPDGSLYLYSLLRHVAHANISRTARRSSSRAP